MTGRQKIEAALSRDGTPEFAAVTNYQSITLRDHWEQATDAPWWWQFEANPERAAQPWIDMIRRTDEDWFTIHAGHNRSQQRDVVIEVEGARVWQMNRAAGERNELRRQPVSGDQPPPTAHAASPGEGIDTPEQLEAYLGPTPEGPQSVSGAGGPPARAGEPPALLASLVPDDGTLDLPRLLLDALPDRMPFAHVAAPWWLCYGLWGFQGVMERMADAPALVKMACDHYLQVCLQNMYRQAAIGARLFWIEDCMTDMISPAQFRQFGVPYIRRLTEAAREAGLYTVYYFCGQVADRLDQLLDSGADALSLEESKKTFSIDIMELAEHVQGRMALLGNIDAINLMEHGSDAALQAEIARQCEAGRVNKRRFIASFGSPITPGTPLRKVRRYCDLVHML